MVINLGIFKNDQSGAYKWLSLESDGSKSWMLYESKTDTADEPRKRPNVHGTPGHHADFLQAVERIKGEGYTVVRQL
jgi:hypothetical protein